MSNKPTEQSAGKIETLDGLSKVLDYSLLDSLNSDPQARENGEDFEPRQVFSGHYVPVKPTPIASPQYIAHSETLFKELGFDDALAQTEAFQRLFSGDVSHLSSPFRSHGWATGYALSIYGTEYTQQCPFQTGNGYGDGRAISVLEMSVDGKGWEMQLKGGGRTPYCRGADGRAVLRSSVREFLAQEHMHALGVPTSRSLCLFASQTERVNRPWYSEGSDSMDPDMMVSEPVAISTRVAPSFLRVGQLELFARRARSQSHANAMLELEMIVLHLIQREYSGDIPKDLALDEKLLKLASAFCDRLTSLVTHWLRVGYCQGNFNSDNCACGGYTLDYGPFGFCERFEPFFQPWTGGGQHFSFLNQPAAAKINFDMFCKSLQPLLESAPEVLAKLEDIRQSFVPMMQEKMERMWAAKLGLRDFQPELFSQLITLMVKSSADFTLLFRTLCDIPQQASDLESCFYDPLSDNLRASWSVWLQNWHQSVSEQGGSEDLLRNMKRLNPKYSWREWLVVPAYQQAKQGNYALIKELQQVLTQPYEEQSTVLEQKYCQLRPEAFFDAGGVSHYSCSS